MSSTITDARTTGNGDLVAGLADTHTSFLPRNIAFSEKAMVVFAFITILFGSFEQYLSGSQLFLVLSGGIYLGALLTMMVRGFPKLLLKVLWQATPLLLLLLLTLVSTLWSQAPDATFRRSLALLMSSSFAIYLAARFDLRTFCDLLVIAFSLFMFLGVVAAIIPGVGIAESGAYVGSLQGFTGQKNDFGRTVALGVALIPAVILLGLTNFRKPAVATLFVAVIMLFFSQSATALVAACAGIGLGTMLYLIMGGTVFRICLRIELRLLLGLLTVAASVLTVVWGSAFAIQMLNRDPTLSGRIKLWHWALELNADRFWLGSGYRAFWIDDNTRYFFMFFAWQKDQEGKVIEGYGGPTHAHSGYIDTFLELGAVGSALLAFSLIVGLVHLRRALTCGNCEVAALFAVVTSFLLIYAYAARSILQHSHDLWFLYTALFMLTIRENVVAEKIARQRTAAIRATMASRRAPRKSGQTST